MQIERGILQILNSTSFGGKALLISTTFVVGSST